MNRRNHTSPEQLGFDALLAAADDDNRTRNKQQAHAHLPGSMEDALPFFRALLEQHHAAMVASDLEAVVRLRSEAHDLAYKLNGYDPGILADENAPGCVLDLLTTAEAGAVPIWGQSGSFVVSVGTMRVRIEMDGVFGIGTTSMAWMGFSAHAVDLDKPFLTGTGYRSFLGVGGALRPGYTPDTFTTSIIGAYVERDLKGKFVRILPLSHKKEVGEEAF